jgi:hypothetical protein
VQGRVIADQIRENGSARDIWHFSCREKPLQ